MNMMSPVVDADALCRKAQQFLDAGRPGAARPLLAAAQVLKAAPIELALLQMRLVLTEGTTEQALAILDSAIAAAPQEIRLLNARSDVRHQAGDWAGAAADAAEAVTYEPSNAEAKARLGVALLELGYAAEAAVCLGEALGASPRLVFCREALARALEIVGDIDNALRVLIDGIQLKPAQVTLVNAAIKLTLRLRDFSAVVGTSQEARTAGIANAETFVLMGHALGSIGRLEEAAQAYQEAIKLAPEDPVIRQYATSAAPAEASFPTAEIRLRHMFNHAAGYFNQCAKAQKYAVPALIAAAVARHPKYVAGGPLGPVLDLGCGTGLVAAALGELPLGPFTGVDISPSMLAKAQETNCYADLHEGDIVAFLNGCQQRWPLITAGDVIPYVNDFPELLARVRQCLAPDGWFVFSVETLIAEHSDSQTHNGLWALQRQGRLGHSEDYILDCVVEAGFRILRQDHCALRWDFGVSVAGLLLTIVPAKA